MRFNLHTLHVIVHILYGAIEMCRYCESAWHAIAQNKIRSNEKQQLKNFHMSMWLPNYCGVAQIVQHWFLELNMFLNSFAVIRLLYEDRTLGGAYTLYSASIDWMQEQFSEMSMKLAPKYFAIAFLIQFMWRYEAVPVHDLFTCVQIYQRICAAARVTTAASSDDNHDQWNVQHKLYFFCALLCQFRFIRTTRSKRVSGCPFPALSQF